MTPRKSEIYKKNSIWKEPNNESCTLRMLPHDSFNTLTGPRRAKFSPYSVFIKVWITVRPVYFVY